MKNYFTVLLSLVSLLCFGQRGIIDSVKLNPFPNKSTTYIGVLTFDEKEKSKVLSLNADYKTKIMSDVVNLPYELYKYFVYLEGATTINLQADFKKDNLGNYRYTIIRTNKDGSRTGNPDAVPKAFKGINGILGENKADFGTYNITDEILKFSIYKIGKGEKEYEVIIYNKPILPAKIILANFVKSRAPKVEKIALDAKKDKLTYKANGTTTTTTVTSKTITTDQSEYTNLNVHGDVIDLDPTRSYVDFSIASIENLFLYHILIKRSFEGKTENTFLDNLNWMPSADGDFRIWLDIKDFTKPGKYELIVYPKIGPVNVNKIENATSIKFELKAEYNFLKKKV